MYIKNQKESLTTSTKIVFKKYKFPQQYVHEKVKKNSLTTSKSIVQKKTFF